MSKNSIPAAAPAEEKGPGVQEDFEDTQGGKYKDEDQSDIPAYLDPEEHDHNHEEAVHFLRIAQGRILAIPEGVKHGLGDVLKAINKALGDT